MLNLACVQYLYFVEMQHSLRIGIDAVFDVAES